MADNMTEMPDMMEDGEDMFEMEEELAFWGAEITSGTEPVIFSPPRGTTLHITGAALGEGKVDDKTRVMLKIFANETSAIVCSLRAVSCEQQVLDLSFPGGKEVKFMVLAEPALTSPVSMCLTGNLHPVEEEMMGGQEGMQFMPEEDDELEGEESEEEEEQPAAKGKDEVKMEKQQESAVNDMLAHTKRRSRSPSPVRKVASPQKKVAEKKQAEKKQAAEKKKEAEAKKEEAQKEAAEAKEQKQQQKKEALKKKKEEAAAKKKEEAAKKKEEAAAKKKEEAAKKRKQEDDSDEEEKTPKKAKKNESTTNKIITTGSGLRYVDHKIGTGPVVKAGKKILMRYTGKLTKNNRIFDSNINGREPFAFRLGRGEVIAGWDQGVSGMRVGGQRSLIIPAKLGYGYRGAPPDIPPNAELFFDVEVVGMK